MSKKPSAADRTVDMFTGSTNLEAATQSDVTSEARDSNHDPSVEANADRYRDTAFSYQEYVSKHFNNRADNPGKAVFRLSARDGMLFLEQFRLGVDKAGAYHWAGVMFHQDDLRELTEVFVNAWRRRNDGK